MNELENPYPEVNYNEGTGVRVVGVISEEDNALLKQMQPKRGLTLITINMFIKSLCDQLRAEGRTYYSPENRERFIKLVQSRCAPTELVKNEAE